MSTTQHRDATYAVGDSLHERRRLQEQSNIINPFTRRMIESAGITTGMRVLDLGSGVGDVAFLLADKVGPSGHVVGIDRNAAILETANERAEALQFSNISFVASDLRELDLQDEFDAIVGRLVLMYVAEPVEAIRKVLRFLRPGGIIAFQEVDFTTAVVSVPVSQIGEKVRYWVVETLRRANTQMDMGYKLRPTLMDAGLPEPKLHFDAIFGGGEDWEGYEYAASTVRSLLPYAEQFGVATKSEVDVDTLASRFRKEVVEQNGVVMMSTWISAWTIKA